MSDLMKEQKLYLEARLRECETKPELNRNQIAEYRNYLDMLASSKNAAEYADAIASSGDMFSLSQAEQLDRYENSQKIKKIFGDEKGASAEQIRIDAVKQSTGHADLYTQISGVSDSVNERISVSRQAVEQVMNLIGALVYYGTACASRKSERKTGVLGVWNNLASMDPDITFDKIISYPPYRSVIPFDDARIRRIESWLKEVLR